MAATTAMHTKVANKVFFTIWLSMLVRSSKELCEQDIIMMVAVPNVFSISIGIPFSFVHIMNMAIRKATIVEKTPNKLNNLKPCLFKMVEQHKPAKLAAPIHDVVAIIFVSVYPNFPKSNIAMPINADKDSDIIIVIKK